ncbi:flagellar basal body P-ring formation chaperone FlgA [Thiosocius teredinicola]|uniref:flagellar basal body P-ring formation chaperone FlgA n=1 Tax=Thiosocius teredinicola TaxID=1973002 RepID=UPI0013DE3E88
MRTKRRKFDTWLLAACCLLATAAHTSERKHESHDAIRAAAEAHVLAQADEFPTTPVVKAGDLDSRLKLSACDEPLETYDSPNGLNRGRGVVGVRCPGSTPWKIYVPVQIALMDYVVTTRRPLVRGQVLDADDLMLSETDISRLHKAYFTDIKDVVGLRTKRSIGAGSTLHAGLLKREKLVKRGSQVDIIADIGGLHVAMKGKALADGGRGDRIRVKNLTSGRVVTGEVTQAGTIRVMN